MFGHQVVSHLVDSMEKAETNPVDGDDVPASHFGVILTMEDWNSLSSRLKESGQEFIIEPHIRFKGEPGEQATMFFLDPCGNAIEFKAFNDDKQNQKKLVHCLFEPKIVLILLIDATQSPIVLNFKNSFISLIPNRFISKRHM